jgi:hypothetical protein
MTIHVTRSASRFIRALPVLALCALTSAPIAGAEPPQTGGGAGTAGQKILFAEEPAILILVDGEPVYRPLAGTDLQRISNTNAFIVRDSAGIHYLKVLDGWMEAYELIGLWSPAGAVPHAAEVALRRAADSQTIDLLAGEVLGRPGRRLMLDGVAAPAIFISTTPAALIVTNGPPRFATAEGSSLEYVQNTTAHVFKEPTDHELYVLISGRWFRAWRTDGPWQFISDAELPADLAALSGHGNGR